MEWFFFENILNGNKFWEKFLMLKEWSDISILQCHSSSCNTVSTTKDIHIQCL